MWRICANAQVQRLLGGRGNQHCAGSVSVQHKSRCACPTFHVHKPLRRKICRRKKLPQCEPPMACDILNSELNKEDLVQSQKPTKYALQANPPSSHTTRKRGLVKVEKQDPDAATVIDRNTIGRNRLRRISDLNKKYQKKMSQKQSSDSLDESDCGCSMPRIRRRRQRKPTLFDRMVELLKNKRLQDSEDKLEKVSTEIGSEEYFDCEEEPQGDFHQFGHMANSKSNKMREELLEGEYPTVFSKFPPKGVDKRDKNEKKMHSQFDVSQKKQSKVYADDADLQNDLICERATESRNHTEKTKPSSGNFLARKKKENLSYYTREMQSKNNLRNQAKEELHSQKSNKYPCNGLKSNFENKFPKSSGFNAYYDDLNGISKPGLIGNRGTIMEQRIQRARTINRLKVQMQSCLDSERLMALQKNHPFPNLRTIEQKEKMVRHHKNFKPAISEKCNLCQEAASGRSKSGYSQSEQELWEDDIIRKCRIMEYSTMEEPRWKPQEKLEDKMVSKTVSLLDQNKFQDMEQYDKRVLINDNQDSMEGEEQIAQIVEDIWVRFQKDKKMQKALLSKKLNKPNKAMRKDLLCKSNVIQKQRKELLKEAECEKLAAKSKGKGKEGKQKNGEHGEECKCQNCRKGEFDKCGGKKASIQEKCTISKVGKLEMKYKQSVVEQIDYVIKQCEKFKKDYLAKINKEHEKKIPEGKLKSKSDVACNKEKKKAVEAKKKETEIKKRCAKKELENKCAEANKKKTGEAKKKEAEIKKRCAEKELGKKCAKIDKKKAEEAKKKEAELKKRCDKEELKKKCAKATESKKKEECTKGEEKNQKAELDEKSDKTGGKNKAQLIRKCQVAELRRQCEAITRQQRKSKNAQRKKLEENERKLKESASEPQRRCRELSAMKNKCEKKNSKEECHDDNRAKFSSIGGSNINGGLFLTPGIRIEGILSVPHGLENTYEPQQSSIIIKPGQLVDNDCSNLIKWRQGVDCPRFTTSLLNPFQIVLSTWYNALMLRQFLPNRQRQFAVDNVPMIFSKAIENDNDKAGTTNQYSGEHYLIGEPTTGSSLMWRCLTMGNRYDDD